MNEPQVTDGDLVESLCDWLATEHHIECDNIKKQQLEWLCRQYRTQVVAEKEAEITKLVEESNHDVEDLKKRLVEKEAQIGQMIKRGNEVLDQANKERVELMATKAQLTTLREALVSAEKALKGFVDKCDRGEARSTKSYAEFKESLTLIHAALNTEKV